MKLKTLVFGILKMLFILQLEEFHVRAAALARKQLTQVSTQDLCFKHAILDVNKKNVDFAREINDIKKHPIEINMLATSTQQNQKVKKRSLTQKNGKKERWLAVDEVDYLGPRTHPPTKPPRK